MKKFILTMILFCGFANFSSAQSDPKKTTQASVQKQKEATTDTNKTFQEKKSDEARQKQESKRKAMKEKAKIKEERQNKTSR